MADEPIDLDALLARFDGFGHRDRKAVLAHLAPGDRQRVEVAMAARGEARRREADRIRRAGRQFSGYSPWLSELLQQATTGAVDGDSALTVDAQRAVADVHRALHADDDAAPLSFWDQLRAILSPGADAQR